MFFALGGVAGCLLLFSAARLTWHSKYYPGVTVGGVEVAGLSREEARIKLNSAIADYQIVLTAGGKNWRLPKEKIQFESESGLGEGYRYGRRLEMRDYTGLLLNRKTNYPLRVQNGFDREFEKQIKEIAAEREKPGSEANIEFTKGKIVVVNGDDGVILDRDKLWGEIARRAENLDPAPIEVPMRTSLKRLSEEELGALRERGEKLVKRRLTVEFEDVKIELGIKDLLPFLAVNPGGEAIDQAKVDDYTRGLAESFNREAQNAKFVFENGRVEEFAPGKDGVAVEIDETRRDLAGGLTRLLTEDEFVQIKVTAKLTPPAVSTDKVNDLGIKERIGRGESYYAHSIANRVYNVGLASTRINTTLIPPGGEFSFNQSVGEVSGATGYKTAYVISGGRTVLGDGGGVCQVSTTIFRAALNAGLPITERWAHAYRVGYYEQNSKAGIDATVYAPSKDFKFKNDTPGHILVQLINDPKNLHLAVEIYGTNDGRIATVSEPKVWGISPPPPDIYQDDASVPAGQTRQVDWAAWGTKASFEYRVIRNGETLSEKTFSSSYRPWANVYLRGTGL